MTKKSLWFYGISSVQNEVLTLGAHFAFYKSFCKSLRDKNRLTQLYKTPLKDMITEKYFVRKRVCAIFAQSMDGNKRREVTRHATV